MKHPINWLGWSLAGAQVAMCGALAWAWLTPQGEIRDSRWQPPLAIKADIESLLQPQPSRKAPDAEDDRQLLQMQERPLFAISRRPPPPPPPPKKVDAEPPPEQDQWSQAKVTGLFDGSVSGAIIVYGGKEQRLMLNQSLDGWKLLSIQGRGIEIGRGETRRSLTLTKAALDKAPALPAGARLPRPSAGASGGAPDGGSNNNAAAERPEPPRPGAGGEASLGGGPNLPRRRN